MAARSEWSTVFERFPAGRVPVLGPVGIFVHDWSKPADGHPQLFDQRALELLTTAHPRLVATVYSVTAGVLIAWSIHLGLGTATILTRLALGVLLWSFTECGSTGTRFISYPGRGSGLRSRTCRTASIMRIRVIRIGSCCRSS